MKMSFLRLLLLIFLFFVLVGPALIPAREYHLFLRGAYALPQLKVQDNFSSFAKNFGFIISNESNRTGYSSAAHAAGEIGLLVWLTPAWGFSLQAGLAGMNLEADNEFRLDWTWFDGDRGDRRLLRKYPGRLTRYWLEAMLNKRIFLGRSSALILGAGGGLQRFSGSLAREAGWAEALETETNYYIDWFQLPLAADVKADRLTGRIGLDLEQRLGRRFTLQTGLIWRFSAPFRVPWRLQERGSLAGFEGNLVLDDNLAGLEFEREVLKLNPTGLHLHVGLQMKI